MNQVIEKALQEYRLLIATPFYEIKAYSPYIPSLLYSTRLLDALKIPWDIMPRNGDSYVTRAKNYLVHQFLKSDYTHLWMIDSDLSWNVEGFMNLLKASMMGAEIVGGAFPNKNNWESYGIHMLLVNGKPISRTAGDVTLYEVGGIPGGYLIYSRKAFERTRPLLKSYRNYEDQGNDKILQCFKCDDIDDNGNPIGEDYWFQQKYRQAGGVIWLEPDISFGHYGVQEWRGNYKKFMDQSYSNEDNNQPLISVVIPCYNQGMFLNDAINSALNQMPTVEVIVVNDGSTDNTAKVAECWPVSIINQPNRGLSAARNAGITIARGKYIVCLDADDMLAPNYIKKCIDYGKLTNTDIVGTGIKFFGDIDGEHLFNPCPTYAMLLSLNQLHCAALFKKEIWEKVGGFDEGMREGYEDWDFWLRVLREGYKASTVQEPLLLYRKHGPSMISRTTANHQRIAAYILAKHVPQLEVVSD